MKKQLSRIILAVFILSMLPINAFGATVGQSLKLPETGWKRYNDNNSSFVYEGNWSIFNNGDKLAFQDGQVRLDNTVSNKSKVKFKFYGTKLRIIMQTYYDRSEKIQVTIDGKIMGIYNTYRASGFTQYSLNYQISGLEEGNHHVELQNLGTRRFFFDCIDIDATGELLPYNAPSVLTSTPSDSSAHLTWTANPYAASYDIKRSLTPGGTYTTIATDVTDTNYTDTNLINGTKYYYTVAINVAQGVGMNSNEASVTLPLFVPNVTLINKDDKNMDLAWNPISGATSYEVSCNGIITTVNTPNVKIQGLSANTNYTLKVRALSAQVASEWSTPVVIKTEIAAPAVPTNLTVAVGNENSVRVSWNAAADATAYEVLYPTFR